MKFLRPYSCFSLLFVIFAINFLHAKINNLNPFIESHKNIIPSPIIIKDNPINKIVVGTPDWATANRVAIIHTIPPKIHAPPPKIIDITIANNPTANPNIVATAPIPNPRSNGDDYLLM